jgi:hypothetical protein
VSFENRLGVVGAHNVAGFQELKSPRDNPLLSGPKKKWNQKKEK